MTVDEIKRLKVARVKCDKSLLFFTRYFFKVLKNQKFICNWHHKDLCEAFERVGNYKTHFLNINQPPRTSKTELAVNFVAKSLGENPCGNYLYITASDDLRSEFSVKIRDIVTSRDYKAMYGLELKKDQNAKNLWRTSQGGGLKTATIFGQITGFGAGQMIEHNQELEDYIREFEGCIILDDINKIGDAEAANVNNTKAINRIFDTILSRKNSPDTPLVNIQQRAGMEDATSALLEHYEGKPKVESIVLPIISPDGVPMWEWKFPLSEIESLKTGKRTAHVFETQYMQNPMPLEGLVFSKTELKHYENFPNGKYFIYACADTADEGDDNFAMPIMRVYPELQKVYVFDAIFDKHNLTIQEGQVCGKVKEHKISNMKIESNSSGAYFIRRCRELIPDVEIYGQYSKANKMARILSYSGIVKYHFRFPKNPNPTLEAFMNQVYRLLKTSKKEDDAPDSLAASAQHLEGYFHLFE